MLIKTMIALLSKQKGEYSREYLVEISQNGPPSQAFTCCISKVGVTQHQEGTLCNPWMGMHSINMIMD